MCQAGLQEPCKYKGVVITRSLGGHRRRTPREHRCYHYKRVADAQVMRDAEALR